MTSQAESHTRLHERRLLIARLAWPLFTLTCSLSALSFVFLALSWAAPVRDTWGFRGDAMMLALAFGGIGLLLARRHPENPIGWLLLLAGLINSILEFCVEYATYAMLTRSGELQYGTLAAWIASWLWVIGIAILIYVFLLFPTGHLPSARWRAVAWFFVGAFGLLTFVFMIRPGPLYFAPYLDNPFAVQVAYRLLSPIPVATAAALFLVGISVILRLRRAQGVERQQLKWFAYAATLRAIIGVSESVTEAVGLGGTSPKFYQYLSVALWIAIAVAIAFAILRYRLWDIDILINRTLVYGALTASVVALYVLIVGGSGFLLQTRSNLLGILLTSLLVSFLFRPLRRGLQSVADRFVPVAQIVTDEAITNPLPRGENEQFLTQSKRLTQPTLHDSRLIVLRMIWGMIALIVLGFVAVGVPNRYIQLTTISPDANTLVGQLQPDEAHALEQVGISVPMYAVYLTTLYTLFTLLFASTGLALAWLRPKDRAALLISLYSIGFGLTAITMGMTQPRWHLAFIAVRAVWYASSIPAVYLFPDGRFVPRWTRWLTAIWFIYTVAWLIFPAISPPFGFGQGFTGSELPRNLWILLWVCSGLAAQIYRYRHVSNAMERQQMKWVGFGGLSFVILWVMGASTITLAQLAPMGGTIMIAKLAGTSIVLLGELTLPLSLGASILRYRLFDIDILINRTLVYGSLTALIVAMYLVIVGGLGMLFQTQTNALSGLVAAGIIALLLQPLRVRLQRGVNRLLYGERDDPAIVLTRLAQQMETADAPSDILPNLVQTIAHTLKIPHVAIWLPTDENQFESAAAWGESPGHVEMIPLTYQKETIGRLVVAPRGPHESFNHSEQQLLNTVAALTANTVRAVQLSDELRHSRRRIVSAREDERRRLRRDLHDGLGPQLASQTLSLEAVAQLMPSNPEKAQALLSSLKMQAQEAMLDVRRLVYDLRPPALDDLGLVGALQQSVSRYATGMPRFSFDVPQRLPELPAAVETAAYRIAQEAMINVVRHAGATLCTVRLTCTDVHLIVEVHDNGRGLSQDRTCGVGLQAMKERATELNGQFLLESLPDGGTLVQARLPLGVQDE